MSNRLCTTVLFLSAFVASELQAELVTMSFTAFTRDVVGDPFGITLKGGEPIIGTFTYDMRLPLTETLS